MLAPRPDGRSRALTKFNSISLLFVAARRYVCFSNRPVRVKRFQTVCELARDRHLETEESIAATISLTIGFI